MPPVAKDRLPSSLRRIFLLIPLRPSRSIELDPRTQRTYHYWHVFVPDVEAGQLYSYRVHGPLDPARGMRFDSTKLLLDPYGRGVVVPLYYSRQAAVQPTENTATAMKSVVTECF
ncbi:MAG TPA: hypothetical protein VGY91_03835 [Chthoniobacterales bacterium]|nr:hypothetical protein [Chthoniobacterales bacterium]